MKHTTKSVGIIIRSTRKLQGLTQQQLAMTCNTGTRFISDLENGKPSCEFGKVLHVIQSLGIEIKLNQPYDAD